MTEIFSKPRRRRFTTEYKRRILREAAGCKQRGELRALLRRERLYASHLTAFRESIRRAGIEPTLPGGRVTKKSSMKDLMEQLASQESAAAYWKRRAERAEELVRVQRKSLESQRYSPSERDALVRYINEIEGKVGVEAACNALALARATYYRRRHRV